MYKKYFSIGLFIVITAFLISCENKKSDKSETGKPAGKTYPDTPEGKYEQLQDKYASGWNTWNYRSVTSHVQMPEAFAVNIGFKDYLSKDILQETMLGFDRENLLMGPHAYDGSYTMTELYEWSDVGYRDPMNIRIQSAHVNDDMVILIEPIGEIDRLKKPLVIVQCGMLWNHPGHIEKNDSVIMATIGDKTISVYSTGDLRPEHYVGGTLSPYLAVQFDGPVGISTGSYRSLTEITSIINSEKKNWEDKKIGFGELAEMFDAIQTVIAWNVVYEPNYERVISPVSRRWSFWNRGYVQYCWDTYFAGLQAAATGSKEVAYCNLVEMTKAKEKAGTPFVPNVEQANGFISRDRSQPPVGSMCLNETYKIFREKWILELLYDDQREWNNWWAENRDYNGLLCYGSTPYDPVVGAGGETEDNNTINGWFGASMESGWDGAELYQEVPFDKQKHILKHWDAALNGLYVMDCRALADIAETLGKKEDAKMLRQRANTYQENIQRLWNEEAGFFYNKNWETGEFSDVTNINGFYPLIAKGATDEQAKAIIENYFYNEKHFWGQWIMPTLSKSHPKFKDQRYWDGRIWPPVNYLVYLGLKNYEHVPIVKKAKNDLVRKSKELLLKDWKARRYVRENYDPRTGIGDESKASARFYHWGGLLGLMPIMEQGGLE